jgi:hypothetical protein
MVLKGRRSFSFPDGEAVESLNERSTVMRNRSRSVPGGKIIKGSGFGETYYNVLQTGGSGSTILYYPPYDDYLKAKYSAPSTPWGYWNASTETMVDANLSSSRRWKPVSHQKTVCNAAPFSYTSKRINENWWFGWIGTVAAPPPIAGYPMPLLDNAKLLDARREAATALVPHYRAEMQSLTALVELKDFKSLCSLISGGVGSIADWARKLAGRKGVEHTRTCAELYLANEFGLKPFLSELATAISLMEKAQKQIDFFNLRGQLGATHHFSKVLSESSTIGGTYNPMGDSNGVYWGRFRTHNVQKCEFHAQARVRYTHETDGKFDLWNQTYGMYLTPQAIWELFPFSFVLDWFIGIGRTMEYISRNTVTTLKFDQYSESTKSRSVRVLAWNKQSTYASLEWYAGGIPNPGVNLQGDVFCVASTEQSAYNRKVGGSPAMASVPIPRWNGPTLSNLTTGLAMVRTMMKRP